MKFYTNVQEIKNKIYEIGYENGKRFKRKVPYKPYMFVPSPSGNSKYRTVEGKPVDKIDFDSISEAREFKRKYEDVANWNMYGLTQWQYLYIFDEYKGQMDFDSSLVRVMNIDIEVASDEGFPNIGDALKPITAITIKKGNQYVAFGCGDYTPTRKDVIYIKCKNEYNLLEKFLNLWESENWTPDVITGWNVEFFDIPYIINRIIRIMPEGYEKRMSPWGILREKEVLWHGKVNKTYIPLGITILDYQQLYKKFTYTKQESYSLDFICNLELGERKIDYSDYDSLLKLYKENFPLFMDYNIRDVELVDRLEDKLKFLEQVFTLAYDAKVNFTDTLASVRPWDIIIHNFLLDRCQVVPFFETDTDEEFDGAYVKEPIPGMYNWVVSFDLNSLYPHLIMQYNVGPEVYIDTIDEATHSIENILNGSFDKFKSRLIDRNATLAANMTMYSRKKQGFLSELMDIMYNDRVRYKDMMIEAKKAFEKNPTYENEKLIARYKNMQMAKKIQLNSCYGALGNKYFRWYQKILAEAITLSGQLSIRWIEKHINKFINKLLKTNNIDYVIASDTDSLYINFENIVNTFCPNKDVFGKIRFIDKICNEIFQPEIDKIYESLAEYTNAFAQKMFMKRENIADKGIWTAKKRYILNVWNEEGVQYKEPKLKMMGIETVRSSTPQVVRSKLKEAIKIIINDDRNKLIELVNNFREEFNTLSFEDIAFPRGVSDIDKWYDPDKLYMKGTPIHVKASLVYNNIILNRKLDTAYPLIYNGDRIRFAYLKYPNSILERSIACSTVLPKEFGLDGYIDYETQFNKTFLEPLKHILDAINWTLEDTLTLESIFE